MRLAVFTNQFPGRVSTFFARDMRGLLAAGVDIDIFAFYPYDPKLWQYVPEILREEQLPKTRIHHVSFMESLRKTKPWPPHKFRRFLQYTASISISAVKFGIRPLAKSLYVHPKAWSWARQFDDCYDHVLAYWGNYSATCAYVFHRLMSRPIPYSIYPHAGMDLYHNQTYLQEKLLYADNIILDCEFNKQFIRQLYPALYSKLEPKIHLYDPGVDLAEFAYQPNDKSSHRIIGVGRLVKQKGYSYLLQAAQELKRRQVKFQIELVGDGEEGPALRDLARELCIEDHVRFSGWLPPVEVRNAIRQAALLVHPSPDLGDAVPNVIKEAMALGTPVVATRVVGIPELLDNGKCGMLVTPGDVNALADALEVLLQNDTLRLQHAVKARQYAERKFDMWKNGQSLAELLRATRRMCKK